MVLKINGLRTNLTSHYFPMGIKHLWTILTPFCERRPLYELRGKTVAVDLSCWICEAQNIAEYHVQPRMYLRNLYFRTCYLLLMDVRPVFVLEGKAPQMKYDTIAARNAVQFKGSRQRKSGAPRAGKDRSRFNSVLRSCEDMLRLMGLACVKGEGEAESMCAYLNSEGLVDGCISQDSDCFAYGARIVYRNFSIASQGAHAASGGAIDIYDIDKPYNSIDFGRNKIVSLALLCGSDYNEGVQGIGKESVMRLFERIPDDRILSTLRSWRSEDERFRRLETRVCDKSSCTSCGHVGRLQTHNKSGCRECGRSKGCDDRFKEERVYIKNEVNVRSKALQDPEFPDEDLVKEFLRGKDTVSRLELRWKRPDVVGFVTFTTKFLQWEEIYGFQKILPILTRWQCLNYKENKDAAGFLHPDKIKKIRNPKGVPSYEIIWTDPHNHFKSIFPEDQIATNNINLEELYSTIEPQELVDEAYPDLVEAFRLSKIKPKKITKRKKADGPVGPVEKKTRKKKGIDDYFRKNVGIEDEFSKLDISKKCSTPKKDSSSFCSIGEDDEASDLSGIIDDIISTKPDYIEENLRKFEDVSSFFTTSLVENDVFEQTFNYKSEIEEEGDDDDDEEGSVEGSEEPEGDVKATRDSFLDELINKYK